MIYSKELGMHVPVCVTKKIYPFNPIGANLVKYTVKDKNTGNEVGSVELKELHDGIFVDFMFNDNPKIYSGFGKVADQIEVEHCLNMGLKDFKIESHAAMNSHALHYLRGKRFKPDGYNEIIRQIIQNTPKGQQYNTSFLGSIYMYMPKSLIEHYVQLAKEHPILKSIK